MFARPAQRSDLFEIGSLHVRAWQAAYRGELPDVYLDALDVQERMTHWATVLERADDYGSELIVVESLGLMAGFACFGPATDGGQRSGEVHGVVFDEVRFRTST